MRKNSNGPAGYYAHQAVKSVPGTVTSSHTGLYLEGLLHGTTDFR